jgi:hypothetical protein
MSSYNTKEGVRAHLTDLAAFHRLLEARHVAGYEHEEHLAEFCVLGRFYLDNSGNCGTIIENIPAELFKVSKYSDARCPEVMTADELEIFMRGELFSWTHSSPPPEYAQCTVCDKAWTIADCHDAIHETVHDEAPLCDFAGQAFGTVRQIHWLAGIKRHWVDREILINTERKGKPDGHMRDGRPWFRVKDSHVVLPADVATLQISTYTHDACYRKDRAKRQRAEFEELFARAGFPRANLISAPNEYEGEHKGRKLAYYAAPWYLAQVGDGPVFKIGWRKSVINIDWSASGKSIPDLTADDVTKAGDHVHAHGYEKAAEYLAKLVPALEAE